MQETPQSGKSPLSSNCPLISSLQDKSEGAIEHYRQVCQDLVEQVNEISALMKKLNLKDWRDLDRSEQEQDSKELRNTFSEVSSGFSLF